MPPTRDAVTGVLRVDQRALMTTNAPFVASTAPTLVAAADPTAPSERGAAPRGASDGDLWGDDDSWWPAFSNSIFGAVDEAYLQLAAGSGGATSGSTARSDASEALQGAALLLDPAAAKQQERSAARADRDALQAKYGLAPRPAQKAMVDVRLIAPRRSGEGGIWCDRLAVVDAPSTTTPLNDRDELRDADLSDLWDSTYGAMGE
ncbi:hypothetical protein M885DRAFT_596953 [Pelagophyceae sp. CCMP2097]|nr:hypothetical protein M885DRAFT_596953 [Pelagophyceae sp. CCMP2097]